jgi:hypothetical protein
VSNWAVDKEKPTGSDHEVVTLQITLLHPNADFTSPEPHLNWKKTNWDTFTSTLQNLSTEKHPLWSSLHENPTQHNLDEWATLLHDMIISAAVTSTPLLLLICLFVYSLIACNLRVMVIVQLNTKRGA